MTALKDQLVQDSASLRRFVCLISDLCEDRSSAPAHLDSSERFFRYIQKLAHATCSHLSNNLQNAKQPRELLQLRSEIASLRISWRFLHELVKPALDADTLKLPTSLIKATIERFREIPKFRDADFVFYHSDVFNYLNVNLAVLKPRAKQISSLVLGPEFPPNLSIIGIPYSQASSLFMNCLIPHEMGHYAFGELSLAGKFKMQIENELIARVGNSISQEQRGKLADFLTRWIEEVFCDAFAVRLVGFCFSFAFAELFDVSKVLDEQGNPVNAGAQGETEFSLYPPNLLRLRQQAAILRKDGWWDEVEKIDSQYTSVLKAATTLVDNAFLFSALRSELPHVDPALILQSFFAVLPKVEVELDECTSGIPGCSQAWSEMAVTIEKYLEFGIVPSTLRHEADGLKFSPDPISLLNSAYRFYVCSMPSLMNNFAGSDSQSISDRTRWAKRIEVWTAKAIEDVLLLRKGA